MVFERLVKTGIAILQLLVLCTPLIGQAQVFQAPHDWREDATPPAPAFDTGKLLTFKLNADSSMVFGVDPASISISKTDAVVRYVMVVTSDSGTRNIMYEGLRCATGEFITYARQSDGKWHFVDKPQWRSVFERMPSSHPLVFAKAGACDAGAPPSTVADIVAKFKNPRQYLDY